MATYSSEGAGIVARVQEARHLVRFQRARAENQVSLIVRSIERLNQDVGSAYGFDVRGKHILEIGCGQLFPHSLYLSQANDVVAIDQSVVPRNPLDYMVMLRQNGALRVVKTVARKSLGVDRRLRRALAAQLDVGALRFPDFRVMDAQAMDFDDGRFDFAFSYSVFEHLKDPGAVLDEVRRVLRPGGVAYLHVHLFTSDSGAHDPRIMSGSREDVPFWAHLRPKHADAVQSNAYLNRWRVDDWMALFQRELPGCTLRLEPDAAPSLVEELRGLREQGELEEYRDDELLSLELFVTWQKPAVLAEGGRGRRPGRQEDLERS